MVAPRVPDQAPGLHCEVPQGAFYAFASCAALLGKQAYSRATLGVYEMARVTEVAHAIWREMCGAEMVVIHISINGIAAGLRNTG